MEKLSTLSSSNREKKAILNGCLSWKEEERAALFMSCSAYLSFNWLCGSQTSGGGGSCGPISRRR